MVKKYFKTCLYLIVFIFLAQTAFALNLVKLSPGYYPNTSRGRPLSNAYIYVGIPDLDPTVVANQKTLSVQQEDGTIVAVAQPIRTNAGGVPQYLGSPVTLLVEGDYSLTVLDSHEVQIYYIPSTAYEKYLIAGNYYYPDATEADQGVVGSGNSVTDIMATVGAVTKATMYFSHDSGSATTTYTFITDTTITDNFNIIIEEGAILEIATTKTLTINGSFKSPITKVFSCQGTGKVSFGLGSVVEVYPQWWDSVADGSSVDDEVAINAALVASKGLITKLLPSSNPYVISNPIIVYSSNRLLGSGSSSNQKSQIKLDNNADCNVIQSNNWVAENEWWHWGEIAWLNIDGNKVNQSSGDGIAIYQMGETSHIHNVLIGNANDYGIHIKGISAPCKITDPFVYNSGIAAYYLEGDGAAITSLRGPSGDDNNIFIKADGSISLFIENLKAEGAHDTLFDLRFDNPGANRYGVTVLGGYANGDAAQTNLFYLDGAASSSSSIVLINFRQYNYTNLINDQVAATTIATGGTQSFCGLYIYGGRIITNREQSDYIELPYNTPLKSRISSGGATFDILRSGPDALQIKAGVSGGAYILDYNGDYVWHGKSGHSWTPYLQVGGTDITGWKGQVMGGSGSPEGSVTANVGALYLRSDGGAGTTLYIKESGTGNTGWVGK